MATWKKVIVSGSNAELNHITASGTISASGKLYGNLDLTSEQTYVVIYNNVTGELEYKELNLVNAQRAPELFLIDFDSSEDSNQHFILSFDSGSPTQPINAPHKVSASLDGGSTFTVTSNNAHRNINDEWADVDVADSVYFDPANTINQTASKAEGNSSGPGDARNGLIVGSSKQDITIHFQSVNSATDYTAVPQYQGPAYTNRAFDCPPGTSIDTASIQVYLNDNSTPAAEFFLTASTNNPSITDAISYSGGTITANISPSGSSLDLLGVEDTTKSWRSGSITISSTAQEDGYNYAYVIYTGSRSDGSQQVVALTNFAEWFYDNNGASANLSTISPDEIATDAAFDANDTSSISGIKFYTSTAADSATIVHQAKIDNYYKNVYPISNGIRYENITNDSIDSIQVTKKGTSVVTDADTAINPDATTEYWTRPELQDVDGAHNTDLNVTSSIGVTFANATFHQPQFYNQIEGVNTATLGGFSSSADVQFRIQFDHISNHKTNDFRQGVNHEWRSYLVNTLSNTSNEHEFESFRREDYRITSESGYENTSQAAINLNTGSILDETYKWDSEKNVVNGGSGYNEGNVQYYTHLFDPRTPGTSSGDFSSEYGPLNNQPTNYSTATGLRTYYRYFKLKSTQAGGKSLTFEITGNGKVCREADTTNFATNGEGFKMYFWRSRGNEDPGSTSDCNGTFKNMMDSGFKQGNAPSSDSQYIDIRPSYTQIDFGADNTLGGQGFEIGAVKIADTFGSTFKGDEVVIIKIVTPQQWTGNIDAIALRKGNVADGSTPYLGASNTGIDGNDNYTTTNL